MKKRNVWIIIISAIIMLTALFSYLNARFINPADFRITFINVSDEQLDESFDNFSLVFISDIEYGTFFDQKRLEKFAKRLNSLQIDMLIFGGDLFDGKYSPVTEDVTLLTEMLHSVNAPYGKFAILGDFDTISEQRTILVKKILNDAEFELLDGNPLTIHHNSAEFINLIGFNYQNEPDGYLDTFNAIDPSRYTVAIVHGGQFAKAFPSFASSLTISGHSHHKQINLPFMIDYDSYPNTGNISSRKTKLSTTMLYMSNGIGTTGSDYRLFSDPEILFFRFKK